jgi:hypothetical protein
MKKELPLMLIYPSSRIRMIVVASMGSAKPMGKFSFLPTDNKIGKSTKTLKSL